MTDTISAISTAMGEGAIGIVRMSGDQALNILEKIFKANNNKRISELRVFSLVSGKIIDNFNNNLLDNVLISIMKAPNSYTAENVVEIYCHGGILLTKKILELTLKNGARLAEKGEYTKRAFLNGKIDLTQAEAVIELIKAKTEKNIELSLKNLSGMLKERINYLRIELLDIYSHINVVIDYPEEVEDILADSILNRLNDLNKKIKSLADTYNTGRIIREGVKLAIVGKPNVGKSSLLNRLLKTDRAIVTELPGTTRDVLEDSMNINGIQFVISDTAGIRESDNLIEQIGIAKTKSTIENVNLVLFVLDNSNPLTKEDLDIYELIKEKKFLTIINKNDLNKKLELTGLKIKDCIHLSAKEDLDVKKLENDIYNLAISNINLFDINEPVISSLKQKQIFDEIIINLDKFMEELNKKIPLDLASIYLKAAIDSLGSITGAVSSDDILDNIFNKFCVGK